VAVRLSDIAEAVGVKVPTVSRVLNNKPSAIRVSDRTRRRILQTAREMGYHPSAAARALATKRTGQIGFIMSDAIAGGWRNLYFAAYLEGVERVCRRRGFGLNVSRYNLSDVDDFVFPKHVGERSVDGLVWTSYVEASIASRFREFGIPCVAVGQDVETTGLIPTVASDDVSGRHQIVRYAASLGHRRVAVSCGNSRRNAEVIDGMIANAAADPLTAGCTILPCQSPTGHCDYHAARPMMEWWLAVPIEQRPTLIIATDQTLVEFLKELRAKGLRCPEDVSLISLCDTTLCSYAHPELTAMTCDQVDMAETATEMLIDHLIEDKPLTTEMSKNDYPCKLIVRKSCAEISDR